MRNPRSLFSLLVSLPLLIAVAGSANGEPAPRTQEPFVHLTESGLSLIADNVHLDRLLVRIAELYGTPIALEGKFATPITISFRNLSLQNAIRRLVGDAPFMILHEPSTTEFTSSRPSKIWIYANAAGARDGPSHITPMPGEEWPIEPDATDGNRSEGENADLPHVTPAEIEAMAERGTPDDLDALGRIIAGQADIRMRYLAVTLLGDIHQDRAILAIEQGLGDRDPIFRSYVIETLGFNQALDAVRSLGYVIYGEADPSVRLLAVRNLRLREEEPARAFLTYAARDPVPAIRRAAAKALRAFQ